MSKIVVLLLCFYNSIPCSAQDKVALDSIVATTAKDFQYKKLIVPAVLIGYGLVGIESDQLKTYNTQIRDEVTENIDNRITADDFTQYIPAASVYALNALGMKGKNTLRDRSVILATSYLILSGTVIGLKSMTQIERPDGSSKNSFPSGHTATAFAGAEYLWQEYKHVSVWYGITGYAVATGTGMFRMYNNRHWLTDVAAGAAIGILSTKIAYWLNPYIARKISNDSENKTISLITPFFDGKSVGICFNRSF